jgi:membrane fusion protein (multidrug efflux system)
MMTSEVENKPHNGDAKAPLAPPVPKGRKRAVLFVIVLVAVVVGLVFGVPKVSYMLGHVSTDDATVNSHVTYLSARIAGVADEVLADDNQFVEQGATLVRMDAEPYRVAVDQKQAALAQAKLTVGQQVAAWEVAKADLEQAKSQARAQVSGVRASGFLVSIVGDLVRYSTASLQSSVATLNVQKANLQLAQQQYDRAKSLPINTISQEEVDQRAAALQVGRAQVAAAEQSVQQARALLGLAPDAKNPGTVPPNIGETFSGVQYALSMVRQSLAQLGSREPLSTNMAEIRDKLISLSEDETVAASPAVHAAEARVRQALSVIGGDAYDPAKLDKLPGVMQAQKDLEDAELQLRYTEIKSPIAGFVSRRNVNPGTHVQAGQALMAIRPLQDAWVDANFKETQLADLKIGQSVDLRVDAYPGHIFHGRVAGFSPGTGAMLSLLPPENATGNFVKVVQRLPVRIELTEQSSKEMPLFAGLSVVPEVDIKSQPTGPSAGQRLMLTEHPAPAAGHTASGDAR